MSTESFKGVLWSFQGYFKENFGRMFEVSMVFQENFKGVVSFKGAYRKCVLWIFQGCFKEVFMEFT